MERPFLFLSGEFRITMPLVFRHDHWTHVSTARRFHWDNGVLHREGLRENVKGIIYHADVEDKALENHNWDLFEKLDIPCYPPIEVLRPLQDRRQVLRRIYDAGLINHDVYWVNSGDKIPLAYPYVIKTGNEHRGVGKHLVTCAEEMPLWEGVATAEPYFDGMSVRALIVGEHIFGTDYANDTSWIKNSPGCETQKFFLTNEMVDHARACANLLKLKVAGVDYIFDKEGRSHFLEINQFPGLDVRDEVTAAVNDFFSEKMREIEEKARG